MKRHIILLPIFIALLFSNFATVSAQNETHRHNIYIGQAHSMVKVMFIKDLDLIETSNPDSFTIGKPSIRSTPAFQATYDFAINKRFSVGAAYSFQQMTDKLEHISMNFIGDQISNGERMKVQYNRSNIAVRGLIHFVNTPRLDMYIGGRVGGSVWKTTTTNLDNNVQKTHRGVMPSVQGVLGMRYYILPNLGVSTELGFGSPHFFNYGLNYRF